MLYHPKRGRYSAWGKLLHAVLGGCAIIFPHALLSRYTALSVNEDSLISTQIRGGCCANQTNTDNAAGTTMHKYCNYLIDGDLCHKCSNTNPQEAVL